MTKVVINTCYGGFGLSNEAMRLYAKYAGYKTKEFEYYGTPYVQLVDDNDVEILPTWNFDRDDKVLVRVVEELGKVANDTYADLKIVEIPDAIEWDIKEYDGREWVAKRHRTWA